MKVPENILDISALQPDYFGFIFYEDSLRHFQDQIPELPSHIKRVGVFVDASLDEVVRSINEHKLRAVQLHGNESPEFCKNLRNDERLAAIESLAIIKVFAMHGDFDFNDLTPFDADCDYFLFDTKGPLPGGNGYAFDWKVLENYPLTKPFILSGGIGPDHMERLKEFFESKASKYCEVIDVNSGFESKPGLKKKKELRAFKEAISMLKANYK